MGIGFYLQNILYLSAEGCENGRSSERQHACMIGRVAPDDGKANGLRLSNWNTFHCVRLAPSLHAQIIKFYSIMSERDKLIEQERKGVLEQKCRIVVTNNYKDYRMMPGIQVFRPTEVRRLPR